MSRLGGIKDACAPGREFPGAGAGGRTVKLPERGRVASVALATVLLTVALGLAALPSLAAAPVAPAR